MSGRNENRISFFKLYLEMKLEFLQWNKREYINSFFKLYTIFCSTGQSANTSSDKPLAHYEVNGEVCYIELYMQDIVECGQNRKFLYFVN